MQAASTCSKDYYRHVMTLFAQLHSIPRAYRFCMKYCVGTSTCYWHVDYWLLWWSFFVMFTYCNGIVMYCYRMGYSTNGFLFSSLDDCRCSLDLFQWWLTMFSVNRREVATLNITPFMYHIRIASTTRSNRELHNFETPAHVIAINRCACSLLQSYV